MYLPFLLINQLILSDIVHISPELSQQGVQAKNVVHLHSVMPSRAADHETC